MEQAMTLPGVGKETAGKVRQPLKFNSQVELMVHADQRDTRLRQAFSCGQFAHWSVMHHEIISVFVIAS